MKFRCKFRVTKDLIEGSRRLSYPPSRRWHLPGRPFRRPGGPLRQLYSHAHGRPPPAGVDLTAPPAALTGEDGSPHALHGFDGGGVCCGSGLVVLGEQVVAHGRARRGCHPSVAADGDPRHASVVLEPAVQRLSLRLRLPAALRAQAVRRDNRLCHAVGCRAGRRHPRHAPDARPLMGGEAAGAVAISPARGAGLPPAGLWGQPGPLAGLSLWSALTGVIAACARPDLHPAPGRSSRRVAEGCSPRPECCVGHGWERPTLGHALPGPDGTPMERPSTGRLRVDGPSRQAQAPPRGGVRWAASRGPGRTGGGMGGR